MAAADAPVLFVAHGGGPKPLYDIPYERDLGHFLRTNGRQVLIEDAKPKAIIVVTGHWESADGIRISSGNHHSLYYDYNFPDMPEAYQLKYDAPGHPELAERIHESLCNAGIPSILDPQRGWDHGTFIPMMLMHPEADIPIVQVSILQNQDTEAHWNLGQVLARFRSEGFAILASGMTYHNMKALRDPTSPEIIVNAPFERYLDRVCQASETERRPLMMSWRDQEGSFDAHPDGGADHFMPFIVAASAAGKSAGKRIFYTEFKKRFILGSFLWK